jgi:S-adenosylmethionine decarboxylase
LGKIFPDFELDDFVFKPYGYSLNGIRGEDYLTIHVTPQEKSPYVSFETNIKLCSETRVFLNHFLEILKPFSFDVMTFNCTTELDFGNTYMKTIHVKDSLKIGYEVDFRYFNKRSEAPEKMYRYKELD